MKVIMPLIKPKEPHILPSPENLEMIGSHKLKMISHNLEVLGYLHGCGAVASHKPLILEEIGQALLKPLHLQWVSHKLNDV